MEKLNRSDRGAGFISTLRQGRAAAAGEREYRRSEKTALSFRAGSSENICRTVTMNFVKRYRSSIGLTFVIVLPYAVGSLDEAIQFLFYGAHAQEKEKMKMKKMLAMILAIMMVLWQRRKDRRRRQDPDRWYGMCLRSLQLDAD